MAGKFTVSLAEIINEFHLETIYIPKDPQEILIDENDVKASHALTIGQPDADQLYYLQSRGLSTKQAVGLLSVGYFLPVIDLVEDEELKDSLRQEMESKVGLYGHQ